VDKISYVNGEYVEHNNALVHIEDRGYVFSDGVYEVALIKNAVIIDWEEHCQRLQKSLDGLKINFKVSKKELEIIIRELLSCNSMNTAVLYLQITRGIAPRLHQFPPASVKPFVTMTLSYFKPLSQTLLETGAKAIMLPDLRWKLRNLKTISLLPNILAKQEAVNAGAEEAILFEEDGKVTEGNSTNVFMVDEKGCLLTHPANENILGGITRMGVINVAQSNSINVLEQAFNTDSLKNASEVFITSTTKHILPITNIDGKNVADGKVGETTKKLMKFYSDYINKQL
jgi:D-alanine transaminase